MNLFFDFIVDKEAKSINVTREFAANLDLVWNAFTKAEILDQWVAPKPWKASTKEMDFREGGRWLYAMVSTEGARHWSLAEFLEIQPKSSFLSKNSFSDEYGNSVNNVFSLTKTSFKAGDGVTTVYTEKKFDDLAVIEMMVARGFKEGTAAGMDNLDEYFRNLASSK